MNERTQWSYEPVAGHWDEAFRPSGLPRRHWREVAVAIGRMGFEQLTKRWQLGQQLIQTNGVTYNVYGDPQGRERPWLLDPIPLVLGATEWAYIERSISQRATLLNAIQQDLYGQQRLILDHRLPAALAYANPNFLRPCAGIRPKDGVHLHLYAADLARSPDGDWWVLADRTQAPSGIGYALENRFVSARTLPSVFNQTSVRPLAGFFETLRSSLERMAPTGRSQPTIVLMTPGPNNETYFEHSFLARHWGIPLVEGADLAVRDDYVFLKTLSGLEPVDVILRRLDDSFCDPLEMRGESLLGVAGLTQAARLGNVTIANALGSGVMETPAHMAFLPSLCKHILGESLSMPSVATWWCGHKEAREYVLDHLDRLVIKPTFARHGRHPEFPAYLDRVARQELAQRIEARPQEYLAQELVKLSTAPVRTNEELSPRHIVLRVFAAWNGTSYTLLPGGLTRVSTETSSVVVSMQLGGGSKDTWVLTGGPVSERQMQTPSSQLEDARRSTAELPSRVADNFFWLGRYAERVESGVRLVRALLPCLSGEEDFGQSTTLETAAQILQAMHFLPEEFGESSLAEQRFQLQKLLSSLVYDPARTSGIGWNLKNMRRVSWPLKQRLSQDTWRVLQQLEKEFTTIPPVNPSLRLLAQMDLLDRIVVTLSAFAGLLTENSVRGHGWRFLEIGRRLERSLQTCELIDAAMAQAPFEIEPAMRALLEIADSGITYRSRYFTSMRVEFVLELLLEDEANPRSLGFQLAVLADQIGKLPGYQRPDAPLPLQIAVGALTRLRQTTMEDLAARDADGNLAELEEFILKMKGTIYDLSNALTNRHLSLLAATRMRPSG